MQWIFVCFVAIAVRQCTGQLPSAKNASMYCRKLEATNELEMTFNVVLNTDPVGGLWALNNAVYGNNENIAEVTCTSTYNATYKVYTVTSKVDLNTGSSVNDNNVCGRITRLVNGVTTYEWLFMHLSAPPNTSASSPQPLLIQDRDRVYRAVCRMDNLTSNLLTTNVAPQTPNLNVAVTTSDLSVSLMVQSQSGNTYTTLTEGQTINAGTYVRLRGVYARGSYTQYIDAHSVYFYRVTVRGNMESTKYIVVDEQGCANQNASNLQPPFFPTVGFKGSIVGTDNVLVTGNFTIWRFDGSSQLIFEAYFRPCFEPNIALCTDPCLANTNVNELARRRRRQVDDEEPGVVTVVINVSGGTTSPGTAERSSDISMMVIVGATVGAAVLVIVGLLVCLIVLMKRRKFEEKSSRLEYPVVVSPYGQKY